MSDRGPNGSVRGVPEPEATAMLLEVVTNLAKKGLDFERGDARNELEKLGVQGALLDGYLFSLQRTIPGVVHTDRNMYKLPTEWQIATKYRTKRYKLPKLDVLSAKELVSILGKSLNNDSSLSLKEIHRSLMSEIEALG